MALKLMLEVLIGIAAVFIWLFHFGRFWDVMKKGGVPNWGISFYEWTFTILITAIAHFFVGNSWFTLAVASPLWFPYLFNGLDWIAVRTGGRPFLGDWFWSYTFFFLPILVILAYIFAPVFKGNSLQAFNNIEGIGLGLLFGAAAGALAAIGGFLDLLRWKAHPVSGGLIGGIVSWLIPSIVLAMEFDFIAIRGAFQYSSTQLYALGFVSACPVMAVTVFLASVAVGEWLYLFD